MLYLFAFFAPPVAVLIVGKPVQALLNVLLTLFFIIPGWVHAFMVVGNFYADKRTRRLEAYAFA